MQYRVQYNITLNTQVCLFVQIFVIYASKYFITLNIEFSQQNLTLLLEYVKKQSELSMKCIQTQQ